MMENENTHPIPKYKFVKCNDNEDGTTTKTPRKKIVTNNDQKIEMEIFMKMYPVFSKGNGDKITSDSLWLELARKLNKLGPPEKDVAGWKRTWRTIRGNISRKKPTVQNKTQPVPSTKDNQNNTWDQCKVFQEEIKQMKKESESRIYFQGEIKQMKKDYSDAIRESRKILKTVVNKYKTNDLPENEPSTKVTAEPVPGCSNNS